MPDVTLCTGDGCPLKLLCRRYTDQRTSTPDTPWFGLAPYSAAEGKCDYYLPTRPEPKKRKETRR